ncbi:hypothetical protein [Roseiterribacter gracilis]|uniref:Uncharacterized protein n=1 Tax=Roseiterribacter gracilis TaxID=2812848 RepID=A0A8S8XGZ0_9PROT|nr:hypothetical protein TMPK1_34590 [Rhodospirillales bacterium TMPK1]
MDSLSDKDEKAKPSKRGYSQRTLKVLWGLSGNRCAHPECEQCLVADATEGSEQLVVGEIAHIYAISEDGPRGKAGLTEAELNHASNLIILCPTHHTIVDGQHGTYPAETLLSWKVRHERKFGDALSISIASIGFAELEVAAKALMGTKVDVPSGGLANIPPTDKIEKNALGPTSALMLTMGAAKSHEVAALFIRMAQLDPNFPDRLRAGFTDRYKKARDAGALGDELFIDLLQWACGGSDDHGRQASGLCILSHLFILCDVFEK